jgi:hypothetical protein
MLLGSKFKVKASLLDVAGEEGKLWDAGEVSGSSLTSIGNPIPSSKYGKLTIELFTTTFVNR